MSLTPVNSRMMSPGAWGLKLTPSNSPYAKTPVSKSPVKANRQDFTLSLKQVIGTTASSANAFDSLPSGRFFAFTAGAAAVIATVDDDGQVTQRFYRARPTATPLNPATSVYNPSTPTNSAVETRTRTAASLRESGIGVSPFGSPAGDWTDSPGGKSWTARERVKAATCVSCSPDGKHLAVGETGYKPRVLIFSTSPDASPDTPLTSISDHTFGVRCVAFSPDSQYLASLGATNDGFLFIWSINSKNGSATLLSSNKCTSTVMKMAWLGSNLITVGTRHVKVWRVEETAAPLPVLRTRQSDLSFLANLQNRTLQGRPCILGPLLESTFTSVVAVAPNKAIICSDKGDICLLDDSDGNQAFGKIGNAGFGVTSMAMDSKGRLHLAGSQGGLNVMDVQDLLSLRTPPQSPSPIESSDISGSDESTHIEALTTLNSYLVTVDSRHVIRLLHLHGPEKKDSVGGIAQQLPAHGESVLGVDSLSSPNCFESSFFTWSARGTVLFWDQDAKNAGSLEVKLDQAEGGDEGRNELKVIRASFESKYLAAGDKYGFFSIIDSSTKLSVYKLKAHAGDITDIAIYEGKTSFIASAGRDRTVQVFHKTDESWDLLQTLDEHVGAVTSVLFSSDGTKLISCSTDRTLVLREAVTCETEGKIETAFVILRTITLKATPVSMAYDPDQEDVLIVSTIDRQVHKYDLQSGHVITSFKATDLEGGDAVVMSAIVMIPTSRGSPVLAGVSSTDKSVRLYDEGGYLIKRDWGHTEGVTGITLVGSMSKDDEDAEQRSLVTVAADGTIFIWSLDNKPRPAPDLAKSMELVGTPPTTASTYANSLVNKPPLRRVLSQLELARFQRTNSDETPTTTPTGSRSPHLRKRASRYSLAQSPRLDPAPTFSSSRNGVGMNALYANSSPTLPPPSSSDAPTRKFYRQRSPSPPSPRNKDRDTAASRSRRRASVDARMRSAKSTSTLHQSSHGQHEFGSLGSASEQVCRMLRAFRKRLANSSDEAALSTVTVRELERELALTARGVGEKAVRQHQHQQQQRREQRKSEAAAAVAAPAAGEKGGVDEGVLVKLLEQFSEKLVLMMDERLEGRIAGRATGAGEKGSGGGDEGRKGSEGGAPAEDEEKVRKGSEAGLSFVSQTGTGSGTGTEDEDEKGLVMGSTPLVTGGKEGRVGTPQERVKVRKEKSFG